MFGKQFQIYGVRITAKCTLRIKKLKGDIFIYHVPQEKLSSKFLLRHPSAEGNYFFHIFPFSSERGNVAGEYEVSVKLTIVFETGSVKRFRCNKSKELPNSFLSFYCENILKS